MAGNKFINVKRPFVAIKLPITYLVAAANLPLFIY